jgi:hypothetical protein
MTHSIGAEEVAAEIPPEEVLEEHIPAVPHLEGHGPVE